MHVLRHADRNRFPFDFCTFGDSPGLHATEAEKLGAVVLRCPKNENQLTFGLRFKQILRKERYDVVHSHVHFFSGALLRWAEAEGVPIRIAHSHTSGDDKTGDLFRAGYVHLMRAWIDQYATHGFAASREAAAALFGKDWEAQARFSILHYAIELSDFNKPISRAATRAQFGIPCDAPVVGHVGRFIERKNHRFLLDIGKELLSIQPQTHFLLVGDGPLRPNIEASAKAMGFNGNMHFAGVRTDVPDLMRAAMDLLIFPSRWEGLPVSLIEAQAAGLPCLVSSAITSEASVFCTEIFRMALERDAKEWARSALGLMNRPRVDSEHAIRRIRGTDFSVDQGAAELFRRYASAAVDCRLS
jgi:glycosyltransferase involved in cell wall biosynthesis